ncbi:hypothetical protein GCM10023205_20620 [Yinghuangia aomiensis]|uniref:Uncharacterized protein n=1 Tax=Yinghuangia aomiensis TaxID=676205 RepID=A0ABP9H052_9ACTN
MRTRGRAVLAAATAAVTLTLAHPAGPAWAGNSRAQEPGWHVWPLGSGQDDQELRAVAALGPRDAWAVGYQGDTGGGPPIVQHFDGTAWRNVPVSGHDGKGQFDAVLPVGPHDVWALGHWNDAAAYNDRALAMHFDGRTWRETPVPATPANVSAYAFGAAALGPSDVWMVGATAVDRLDDAKPLAYHWDGQAWTDVPTPDTGGHALLFAAAPDRTGGVWAVGVAYDANGTGRPLAERWDGRAWRIVDVPHDADKAYSLEGVTVLAPDDVWAVGSVSTAVGASQPLAYHWDGRTWTRAAMPAVDGTLHGVSGERGDVWAVGERADAANKALTMRWDGRTWQEVAAAPEAGVSLFSVAVVPGARPGRASVWAVGSTLPSLHLPWHAVIEGFGAAPASGPMVSAPTGTGTGSAAGTTVRAAQRAGRVAVGR